MPSTPSDAPRDLTVVKIGGSQALQPQFRVWVDALARCGGSVIVVPGGGPFADAVRHTQPLMGFDDATAHHMALMAMEQYGVAIASYSEAFAVAASEDAIRATLAAKKVAVWLPTRMVLDEPTLPATWELTSDSLSAWLARKVGARRLVLVKHRAFASIAAMEKVGGIDPLFTSFVTASLEVEFFGPLESDKLLALLAA